MTRAQPISTAVTLCAVAAMLALSVLPPEHLHTSADAPPVVHRHTSDDAAEHGSASIVDHADHDGVDILEPTVVLVRQDNLIRPLITVEVVIAASVPSFASRVESIDAAMAHGPPIRVDSLRAPPA